MRFLEKLEERERLFVLGFLALAFLMLLFIGISTLYALRQELANEAQSNRDILQKLEKLKSQISSLAPAIRAPEKPEVFTEVNNLLNTYQLNPISINEEKKDSSKAFQLSIRLQSVPMSSLLSFLYDVEYKNKMLLSISFLRIRRSPSKNELYNVNLKIRASGS